MSMRKKNICREKKLEQPALPTFFPPELADLPDGLKQKYSFDGKIGTGTTGIRYKLRSKSNIYHYVCLKTISPTVIEKEKREIVRDALLKEVKILERLSHRCLPQIYEYDITNSLPYYISTYHPGCSLQEFKTQHEGLNVEESVFVISSIIDALEYIHAEGRSHCDLHWKNVLISENVFRDGILIVDFGSGHRESDTDPDTPDGGLVNLKDTRHQSRYRDDVTRNAEADTFKGYDFKALGSILAQMRDCFFSRALPDQEYAYLEFCNALTKGEVTNWNTAKERFLRVIDPYRIVSSTRRLFLSEEGHSQMIPLPVWRGVPVGSPILAVINTRVYQRLRQIKQLSFCDWYFPSATHTRFEHSLGVFAAAKKAIDALVHNREFRDKFSEENIHSFLLAALIHDLGHYPYAHVLEQYVASHFPRDKTISNIVSHYQNTLDVLSTDSELKNVIRSKWGEGVCEQAIRILKKNMPVLSDLLDGPIDCDKIDYLSRDAWHCGIAYGQGLDYTLLLNSYCCVQQGTQLGVTTSGVSAAGGLMMLQDQMLSEVYWHKYSRAVICMFHAILAGIIKEDRDKLEEISSKLKLCNNEESAIKNVILPEIQKANQPEHVKQQLRKLIEMHLKPRFADIYLSIAEYKQTDRPPVFAHLQQSIYRNIVTNPSESATYVPVDWENVKALRASFTQVLKEKNIETDAARFDLIVDVPFGKAQHRQIYVLDDYGGPDIPITEISHLKRTIFDEPALYLSTVRVYISPALREKIGSRLQSVILAAEENFYGGPKKE
jgi:HD superfamily phosphohydrolase/predicted Ser/Thr protein kinase